ncbi:MAG: hypothetical protein MRK02_10055 [Candidatus Scalindua sp.]|nr:hypothetical protein [Candidatus Scalindua sp.]
MIHKNQPIIDQEQNAFITTAYNADHEAFNWQQGVTTTVAGQLTGIDLRLYAGTASLYINLGRPWQSGASIAIITYSSTLLNPDWDHIDLTSANIFLGRNQRFVIGIKGTNGGLGFYGSSQNPYAGGSLYLNGTQYLDGMHDMAFRTYMNQSAHVSQACSHKTSRHRPGWIDWWSKKKEIKE